MRKRFLFIIIAILVAAFVAVYFFFSGTKETELLNKVPKYAKSVLIVDIKGLSTKLLVDELSSAEKSAEKLAEMIPDSLQEIDFSNSGINLLDKAVLFTTELNSDIWSNLLLPLSDYGKFKNFIDSLVASGYFEKRTNGNFLISEKFKLAVNWDRNFVHVSNCTLYPANNVSGLIEVLPLTPDMSILNDSVFTSKLSGDYDFFLYAAPYENYPVKGKQIIHSNFAKSFSYIRFYDGELSIDSEIVLKKGSLIDSIFTENSKSVKAIHSGDSASFTALLNVESKHFLKFLEQFSSIKFNKDKIHLLKAWNGSANIILNPSKYIESEFISYEFDDDFNKVEVKKITKEKVSDIQVNFGIDEPLKKEMLAKLRFFREGKDTLLFKGANFIVKGNGESFLCYNKHLEKPGLLDNTSNASLRIWFNYQKLLPILNDFRIKTDSLWLNKFDLKNIELKAEKIKNLELELKVLFKNENKNAFFSITEKLE